MYHCILEIIRLLFFNLLHFFNLYMILADGFTEQFLHLQVMTRLSFALTSDLGSLAILQLGRQTINELLKLFPNLYIFGRQRCVGVPVFIVDGLLFATLC
jgi:hypothetical protein